MFIRMIIVGYTHSVHIAYDVNHNTDEPRAVYEAVYSQTVLVCVACRAMAQSSSVSVGAIVERSSAAAGCGSVKGSLSSSSSNLVSSLIKLMQRELAAATAVSSSSSSVALLKAAFSLAAILALNQDCRGIIWKVTLLLLSLSFISCWHGWL